MQPVDLIVVHPAGVACMVHESISRDPLSVLIE